MISTALANGFTSPETVTCSQELDILIAQYQKNCLLCKRQRRYTRHLPVSIRSF
ncbi:aspartyl-phosphate phosphatase Spo0E family protein [Bacillus sp. BGMRC 2118]|nr:aspartyl-phosphate phosphatase Spo0E family protein [Bacillus sp. BGMRC 2118]